METELYNVTVTQNAETVAARPLRKAAEALPPELFSRIAHNAPLLLIIGSAGVLIGALILLGAAWMAFLWDFPLARALGAMVCFMASLVLTPSIHLLRYRTMVLRAAAAPGGEAFTNVLRQQVRFWRFVGVGTIIWMALAGLGAFLRASGENLP